MSRNRMTRRARMARMAVAGATLLVAALVAEVSVSEAAPSGRVAWVNSPINGTVSSAPPHTQPYGEHWSVDIQRSTSATARLYVAVDSARDPRVTTRIRSVDYACARRTQPDGQLESRSEQLSRGGKVITVGVFYDYVDSSNQGTRIGTLYFAHVDTDLAVGTYNNSVSRWGGSVGTVGSYNANPSWLSPVYRVNYGSGTRACWTGRHLHLGFRNNTSTPSCWWSGLTTANRSVTTGTDGVGGTYMGYLGYDNGSTARACNV